MARLTDIFDINREDVAVLLLFSLSFVLGSISGWGVSEYPVFTSNPSIHKVVLTLASGLSIAGVMGLIFLTLTRVYVIDPIRERLEEATVTYDGEELNVRTGSTQGDVTISNEVLADMGYANAAPDSGEGQSDDSGSSDGPS